MGGITLTATDLVTLLVASGLLGGIGYAIKALADRKATRAKANSDDASATSVVVAAARELVDPLRKELQQERESHSREIEEERRRVAHVREELDLAMDDVHRLRNELTLALAEVARSKAIIRALEDENLRLRESQSA